MTEYNVTRPSNDPNCDPLNLASMKDLGINNPEEFSKAMKDLGLSINKLDSGEEYYTDMNLKEKCKKESKKELNALDKKIGKKPAMMASVKPSGYMAHAPSLSTDRGRVETSLNPSEAIEKGFEEASIDGILGALRKIPASKQLPALKAFLANLNDIDPLKARNTAQQLVDRLGDEVKNFKESVRQQFTDLEQGTIKPEEKRLWKSEKVLFEYYNGDLNEFSEGSKLGKVREAFRGLKSIETIDKTLRPVLEVSKESLERNIRQSTALDLLETGRSTLMSTFTDQEGLEAFKKKSKSEKANDLKGGLFSIDYDEEVYFSSKNIYDALIFLVASQYQKDLSPKAKKPDGSSFPKSEQAELQKNPLKYYFEHLADYKGLVEEKVSTVEFANLKEEIRLFNAYNNGTEQMGEGGMYDLWQGAERGMFFDKVGNNGHQALLEDHATRNGLIAQSEYIFDSPLLEDRSETVDGLGVVEKARLLEIQNLIRLKRFGEARQMVMELATNSRFHHPTESEIKAEIKAFKNTAEGQRQKAQVEVQVEANIQMLVDDPSNGITDETKALAYTAKVLGRTGTFDMEVYKSLMIKDFFEGKARQDLFFKMNVDMDQSDLSQFDKQLSNVIEDLNDNFYLDISQEFVEKAQSKAKSLGEIILAGAAVYVTGGAAGAFLGGTRLAVAGDALLMGSRVGKGVKYIGGLGLKSTGFLEAQNFLHNGKEWVGNELILGANRDKALLELSMVMASIGALGGVSRFVRGTSQVPGLKGLSSSFTKRISSPVFNRTSEFVGQVGLLTGMGVLEQKYIMPILLDTTDGSAKYRSRKRSWDEIAAESAIMTLGLQAGGLRYRSTKRISEPSKLLPNEPMKTSDSKELSITNGETKISNEAQIRRFEAWRNKLIKKRDKLVDEKGNLDQKKEKLEIGELETEIREIQGRIKKVDKEIEKASKGVKVSVKSKVRSSAESMRGNLKSIKDRISEVKLPELKTGANRVLNLFKKLDNLRPIVTRYHLFLTKKGRGNVKYDGKVYKASWDYRGALKDYVKQQKIYENSKEAKDAHEVNSKANEALKEMNTLKEEIKKKQEKLETVLNEKIGEGLDTLKSRLKTVKADLASTTGRKKSVLRREAKVLSDKIAAIESSRRGVTPEPSAEEVVDVTSSANELNAESGEVSTNSKDFPGKKEVLDGDENARSPEGYSTFVDMEQLIARMTKAKKRSVLDMMPNDKIRKVLKESSNPELKAKLDQMSNPEINELIEAFKRSF